MSCVRERRRASVLAAVGLVAGLLSSAVPARADQFDASFYASFAPLPVDFGAYKLAALSPFAPSPFPSLSHAAEPFGADLSAVVQGPVQSKWRTVEKQLLRESRILQRCRVDASSCPPAARQFIAILDKAQARDGWARIAEINRAINLDIKPLSDTVQYGVGDLWATPLMTFTSHAGDCEDYAIAKYAALREIGFAEEDLRLVIVHDRAEHEDHAVAAVRHENHWLILDNRTLAIRQDSDIAAFDPLFMIDRDGVKRADVRVPGPPPFSAEAHLNQNSSSALLIRPLLL